MIRMGTSVVRADETRAAGRAAAEAAVAQARITRADLVLAFCAGDVDAAGFFAGVRDTVGADTPIVGGSAVGVITSDELTYKDQPAAVAVIEAPGLGVRVAAAGTLDEGEDVIGETIARALGQRPEDRLLLTFYDSVRTPPGPTSPPALFASGALLDGITRVLGREFPVVGAGLLGGYDFAATTQFCGDRVASRHAVGCVLSGAVEPYVAIMHGCVPLDGIYRRITAMEGDVIYELDGRPIVGIIDELFGGTDWHADRPVQSLTLGVNRGERFGLPVEGSYVNRLITGVTPDGRGIAMFEPGLATGVEIQLMHRDNRTMFASVEQNTARLFERVVADGRRPALALYIDCAGRTAIAAVTDREEAAVLQHVLQPHAVPLIGFYSGVEIAPLPGGSRGLDWTGVLLVLAEGARV